MLCFAFTAQAAYGVDGYHENDYQKLRTFFETTTSSGTKNGNILFGDGYNPDNPATWSVTWTSDSPKRLKDFFFTDKALEGVLDLSGCTSLGMLICRDNQLTGINVSGCTSLSRVECTNNQLTGLDVSGCTSLQVLSFRWPRMHRCRPVEAALTGMASALINY